MVAPALTLLTVRARPTFPVLKYLVLSTEYATPPGTYAYSTLAPRGRERRKQQVQSNRFINLSKSTIAALAHRALASAAMSGCHSGFPSRSGAALFRARHCNPWGAQTSQQLLKTSCAGHQVRDATRWCTRTSIETRRRSLAHPKNPRKTPESQKWGFFAKGTTLPHCRDYTCVSRSSLPTHSLPREHGRASQLEQPPLPAWHLWRVKLRRIELLPGRIEPELAEE